MIQSLRDLNEALHSNFSCNWIKEDVKFVHYSEVGVEAFANGKEEGKSGKATFSSTEGLDVLRLAVCIRVALARHGG